MRLLALVLALAVAVALQLLAPRLLPRVLLLLPAWAALVLLAALVAML